MRGIVAIKKHVIPTEGRKDECRCDIALPEFGWNFPLTLLPHGNSHPFIIGLMCVPPGMSEDVIFQSSFFTLPVGGNASIQLWPFYSITCGIVQYA